MRGVRFRGGWGLRGRGMRLTGGKGEGGVRFGGGLRAGEGGRGRGVRLRGGNHCSPVVPGLTVFLETHKRWNYAHNSEYLKLMNQPQDSIPLFSRIKKF